MAQGTYLAEFAGIPTTLRLPPTLASRAKRLVVFLQCHRLPFATKAQRLTVFAFLERRP